MFMHAWMCRISSRKSFYSRQKGGNEAEWEKKLTLMILFLFRTAYFIIRFKAFLSLWIAAYPLISFSLFVCPSQLPPLITHSLSRKPKTIFAIPQAVGFSCAISILFYFFLIFSLKPVLPLHHRTYALWFTLLS
jgi:hypothetical protein